METSSQEMATSSTALGILLVANLTLIISFIRIKNFLSFFIVATYSLAVAITLMAILQYLYPVYILCLTFIIFLVLYTLRFPILQFDFNKESFLLALLPLLCLLSFQVQQDFVGGQDVRSHYLPISRLLFYSPTLPTHWYYEDYPHLSWALGYPPFVTALGALLFHLVGSPEEWITAFLPNLFFVAFLIVTYYWSKEEGVHPGIPTFILLLSPVFIERCSWFSSDAPVIFCSSLFCYTLYKYSITRDDNYLIYVFLCSGLGLLIKYTAIPFFCLALYYLFRYARKNKRLLVMFTILHLPALLLYARNIYYFGTVVPPFLNSLTIDPLLRLHWGSSLQITQEWPITWQTKLFCLALLPPLLFWALVFPFSKFFKENFACRHMYYLLIFFLIFWSISHVIDIRYLMPFYCLVVVNTSSWFDNLVKKRATHFCLKPIQYIFMSESRVIGALIVIFLLALWFQSIYIKSIFPEHLTPDLKVIEFLREKEGVGPGTRVFADTDHGLTWYGNYTVFQPHTALSSPDFLKARNIGDFYLFCKRYNIQYVVNHPWKSPWEENVFQVIEEDRKHFVKLYEDPQWHTKVWKVLGQ